MGDYSLYVTSFVNDQKGYKMNKACSISMTAKVQTKILRFKNKVCYNNASYLQFDVLSQENDSSENGSRVIGDSKSSASYI